MKGRERFLRVLNNEKPDRLPCQVHSWMQYYLDEYLGGMDQYGAYEYFQMDPVIYVSPEYVYDVREQADFEVKRKFTGKDGEGNSLWHTTITTPGGMLFQREASNRFTTWVVDPLIKGEGDFEIWNKYVPLPSEVDWSPVKEAKERIGDRGITRCGFFDFGQGSPWQSFVTMYNIEDAIYDCYDKPQWMHHVLDSMLKKKLKVIERAGRFEVDLVETGGGAGSSTVISPAFHGEFCLPYDRIQHGRLREQGTKVVYHLCGGFMPLIDLVLQNGADGLETLTPSALGGDCIPRDLNDRAGRDIFFIGGFDQYKGFERGNPQLVRKMVRELFEAFNGGGYICSPSDHFFYGDPENLRAFSDMARECVY